MGFDRVSNTEGGNKTEVHGRRTIVALQGYLVHKKLHPPRTLQQDYAYGPTAVLRGGAFSYERDTPAPESFRWTISRQLLSGWLQPYRGT